ncbi:MAG: iron ABC transporter substrate-binding protein [Deltaproteobacteria bacterium]|nr:iron ABC transporter substrate-binding protein [Deltaproteobacteria bacterium]
MLPLPPAFRRAVLALLAALLPWFPLLAPSLGQAAPGRVVTDLAGRRVLVPPHPSRIVALGPGCLRLIVYLAAQDRVVGIEALEQRFPEGRPYCLAHPELARLPVITPGGVPAINNLPDLEGVLGVAPQVIFVTYLEKAKADRLQDLLHLPVVVLGYGPLGSFDRVIYQSLRLAGQVLGVEARARAVVEFLEAAQKDLARRSGGSGPAPPAYVGGLGFKGAQGLEGTDAGYLPLAWVGARNLAVGQGRGGHLILDREKLLALDPPVIFLDGGGLALVGADYAKKPSFYQSLAAFRTPRVYLLFPFNWYATNLGTALADAYALGKVLRPGAFADVDLPAKADEIFSFLCGGPVYGRLARRYGPLGGRPGFLDKE